MRKTLSFIFLFIALITQATTVKVSSVYTEQMSNPLGLDTTTPRFSWQMQSDGQGVMQTAYRILVASSVEMLTENKADLWDSGCIESEQSLWVSYNGFAIIGRCRRQYLLAYTRTVDKSLVHSHTRNMQSGTFHYLRSSKLLTQVARS